MTTRAAAGAALLLLAGCGAFDRAPASATMRCGQSADVPLRVTTDILFVVDDSGSMAAEQSRLATAFRSFITALNATPVQNDYQIGITTTSVDWPFCTAPLDAAGNCNAPINLWTTYGGTPGGRPYARGALVSSGTHPRIMAQGSPTLVADFTANVAVGTVGAGKEQGLRALRYALDDRVRDGSNAGLLRPGARLAIVLVSDEDDCSENVFPPRIVYDGTGDRCHTDAEQALLPPVRETVDFLRGPIAGAVRDVTVAVVAGVDPITKLPVIPACNAGGYKANRYKQLTDAFGAKGFIDDVCQPDFTATLNAIAALLDPGQTLNLDSAVADPGLLQVTVTQPGGAKVTCGVGPAGSAADVVYAAPQGGRPATLTFQAPACRLGPGVSVQVKLLCAG